jgi:hypothetical protein
MNQVIIIFKLLYKNWARRTGKTGVYAREGGWAKVEIKGGRRIAQLLPDSYTTINEYILFALSL